jgi:hypothetical protein
MPPQHPITHFFKKQKVRRSETPAHNEALEPESSSRFEIHNETQMKELASNVEKHQVNVFPGMYFYKKRVSKRNVFSRISNTSHWREII